MRLKPAPSLRLILFSLIAATCLISVGKATGALPNVIVILTDDQGWGDLSASGNTNLQTPRIDSLAREGVSLDRFYVCPVCSPTRAEFLTGRYHPRTGVRGVSSGQERLDLEETTIANAFKQAGYATGAFGKWHNGSQWPYHPNARGFDEYYGFTSGHWGEYFDPPLEHNGQPVRGKGFIADDLTDHAMEFIEKNKARPFFCYLPYNTPHSPWAVPQAYWDRFKNKELTLRAGDPEKENVDETRCVLAMMENLDWNIGRVLDQLSRLGLAENTIVVYFSDNGPNTIRWNGGMKGKKSSTDEGGVRSACFLRWPSQLQGGRVIKEITGAIDLLPTLTALAGVETLEQKSRPLDGRDLSPLLKTKQGTTAAWPERLIYSYQNGNVSVRSQQYRLDPKGALYDMVADPGQSQDIAASEPEVAANLKSAVKAWREELALNKPKAGGGKGQAQGQAPAQTQARPKGRTPIMDPRPYPVGYTEFPRTPLPARDGVPSGGVERSANAPNCSYFVNWTTLEGAMTWDVEVHTAGKYRVEILYTCPEGDEGSTIEISHQQSRLQGKVTPAWDPPLYTNQDTLPRPAAESRMKEFRTLELGTVPLEKGRAPLVLKALEMPGKSVMDVRTVVLTLLTDEAKL